MDAAVGALLPHTGQRDRIAAALGNDVFAAISEAATRRRVFEVGRRARNRAQGVGPHAFLRHQNGLHQASRVGMDGVKDHLPRRPALHDLRGVHHHDVVGHIIQKRQLVCDENHGLDEAHVHHVFEHLDDHFLAGDIQCRAGLIGNEYLGRQDGGDGNDYALLHAAGELHRVPVKRVQRQSEDAETLLSYCPNALFVAPWLMGQDNIFNETDDFARRVQRVHRGLGDVGNFRTQHIFTHDIRVHAGDLLAVDNDFAARVMQGREIVAHQAQRQGRLAAAALPRDAQGFSLLNFKGHIIDRVNILAETGDVFCC